jgi:hypothetical protein
MTEVARFLADTISTVFAGQHAIRPVYAVRAGELFEAGAGPHPSGWLPAGAGSQ